MYDLRHLHLHLWAINLSTFCWRFLFSFSKLSALRRIFQPLSSFRILDFYEAMLFKILWAKIAEKLNLPITFSHLLLILGIRFLCLYFLVSHLDRLELFFKSNYIRSCLLASIYAAYNPLFLHILSLRTDLWSYLRFTVLLRVKIRADGKLVVLIFTKLKSWNILKCFHDCQIF